jgi:hypothetical protein
MPPETEDRKQHRMLQKEYGSLYRIVSDILFRHDPMELDAKHNIGDYDPEVDALLARIGGAGDVGALQDLLFEVFRTDYGEGSCGERVSYGAAAAEIWKAYERHRSQHSLSSLPELAH